KGKIGGRSALVGAAAGCISVLLLTLAAAGGLVYFLTRDADSVKLEPEAKQKAKGSKSEIPSTPAPKSSNPGESKPDPPLVQDKIQVKLLSMAAERSADVADQLFVETQYKVTGEATPNALLFTFVSTDASGNVGLTKAARQDLPADKDGVFKLSLNGVPTS